MINIESRAFCATKGKVTVEKNDLIIDMGLKKTLSMPKESSKGFILGKSMCARMCHTQNSNSEGHHGAVCKFSSL